MPVADDAFICFAGGVGLPVARNTSGNQSMDREGRLSRDDSIQYIDHIVMRIPGSLLDRQRAHQLLEPALASIERIAPELHRRRGPKKAQLLLEREDHI